MSDRPHKCPLKDCDRLVAHDLWMCSEHWMMLTPEQRRLLNEHAALTPRQAYALVKSISAQFLRQGYRDDRDRPSPTMRGGL